MGSLVGAMFLCYMSSSISYARLILIIDQESQAAPQSNLSRKTENSLRLRNVRETVSDVALSCLAMNWSDISPTYQVCQNLGEFVDRR